jgi:acetoin utilization deacetylase AcuC-like enzyme
VSLYPVYKTGFARHIPVKINMKVIFHEDFYRVYTSDPAAAPGRIESIIAAIKESAEFMSAEPASQQDIQAVHALPHLESVRDEGVYHIASLAAGAAIQAARIGLHEPAFALIRPPGHHASSASAWGFCYFNNMAVALTTLKNEKLIQKACVLDIDLHFGDGTVNILGGRDWATVYNPSSTTREAYIQEVATILSGLETDIIGISAGFDHHVEDWGGLLTTNDYETIGILVRKNARRCTGGCFAVLEGGYNHKVLGINVAALLKGLSQ